MKRLTGWVMVREADLEQALAGGKEEPRLEPMPPAKSAEIDTRGQEARGKDGNDRKEAAVSKGIFQAGLQEAIKRIASDLLNSGLHATPLAVIRWVEGRSEGQQAPYQFDPPVPVCNEFWVEGETLWFCDKDDHSHKREKRTLERLLQSAIQEIQKQKIPQSRN